MCTSLHVLCLYLILCAMLVHYTNKACAYTCIMTRKDQGTHTHTCIYAHTTHIHTCICLKCTRYKHTNAWQTRTRTHTHKQARPFTSHTACNKSASLMPLHNSLQSALHFFSWASKVTPDVSAMRPMSAAPANTSLRPLHMSSHKSSHRYLINFMLLMPLHALCRHVSPFCVCVYVCARARV
jgi:hypothetical protein